MATLNEPEVYQSVKRWYTRLQSKSRSLDFSESQTKRAAAYWLKIYCQFMGMSPDTIISERNRQLESKEQAIRRKHEEKFQEFIIYLQTTKNTLGELYSSNSVSTATGIVRSFYKANYCALVEVPTISPSPVRAKKVPMLENIAKICTMADKIAESSTSIHVRTSMLGIKAWICCQKDSGLANVDLLPLTFDTKSSEFGTIRTQLQKGTVPIHIEIHRHKTKQRTDSFFGPNAIDSLKDYLEDRNRGKLFNISIRTIQDRVKRLCIKAKVATKDRPTTPYCFRTAFNTLIKKSGMNEAIAERMMGHSIGRVRGAYLVIGQGELISGMPIKELAEIYMQHYPAIDITRV